MSAEVALSVQNLSKNFRVHHERISSLKEVVTARGRNRYDEFEALVDVSFDVEVGEAVGIIGHNGSGKSTLLKCMAGILRPTFGSVTVNRRMAALLELGAGFHPELTGRDNVFLNAAILGMGRKEIDARFDEIIEFSGLEQFIDASVKTYSSGMYVRLAFAVAINVDPELLLIDEVLAVGDVAFQQKCMEKFVQFRDDGRTLVLVTHDAGSVRNFCDRAIWLDHGRVTRSGDPAPVLDEYTESMLGGQADSEVEAIRRGPGPIRIERVELIVDGEVVDRLRTGDDLTMRLHYATETPVPRPVFAVNVTHLDGAVVTAPSSRDANAVPESLSGRGTVDISMPAVPLLPGPYVTHTEITGFGRQHLYDHLQNALSFDVMSGNTNEVEGLVTLRPSWEITSGH
jgi:ABC-2 type transport system ATP-binding protein